MPSAQELADSAAGYLVPVPAAADGVCDICHGAPNPGHRRCFSCAETSAQVAHPVANVVPISLYQVGGQLHHVLRGYKDGPDPTVRYQFSLIVAALLASFLQRHGTCVAEAAGESWDLVTTVPSGRGRELPHPLDGAIELSPWLRSWCHPLLAKGGGDVRHNHADEQAYVVTEEVLGLRILLLDDTYTTGAALQSAASALSAAGARVIGAVPIGRVIHPEFNEQTRRLWGRATASAFDFERCCLCANR